MNRDGNWIWRVVGDGLSEFCSHPGARMAKHADTDMA